MTQHKDTIDNNGDFLYFDYSDFDFSSNNRDKYKYVTKPFVSRNSSNKLLDGFLSSAITTIADKLKGILS